MSSEKNQPKQNRHPNAYLKYSGMVMQLLVLLLIAAFFGKKIDAYFENTTPYGIAFLVLFSVVAYLVKVYFELSKNP